MANSVRNVTLTKGERELLRLVTPGEGVRVATLVEKDFFSARGLVLAGMAAVGAHSTRLYLTMEGERYRNEMMGH